VVPEQKGSTRNGVELKGLAKEREKRAEGRDMRKHIIQLGIADSQLRRKKKTRADFQTKPRERFGRARCDMESLVNKRFDTIT